MIDLMLVLAVLLGRPGDEPAAAAQAAPSAPPAQAPDPDRPALSSSELRTLRDNNIFAPRTARKRPPVVTGIFMDLKLQCYIVVVEDRNESSLKLFKEPKFLKTGDEAFGLKVGPVTAEIAVFIKDDVSKELRVGDPVPATDLKAPAVAPSSDDPEAAPEGEEKAEKVEIKPLDAEEKTKVLEKMKRDRGKKNRPGSDDQ
jgi:hypothetical protein